MSFPWSYSVLGLVPGLILTVVQAAIVLYTSLVLWEFCLRHPEVKDVCDIGQMLLGGGKWGWYVSFANAASAKLYPSSAGTFVLIDN